MSTLCFLDCRLDCNLHRLVKLDSLDLSVNSNSADFVVYIEAMRNVMVMLDCSLDLTASTSLSLENMTVSWASNAVSNSLDSTVSKVVSLVCNSDSMDYSLEL